MVGVRCWRGPAVRMRTPTRRPVLVVARWQTSAGSAGDAAPAARSCRRQSADSQQLGLRCRGASCSCCVAR
eukprot:11176828-Lingulodinium_polyedra.AAC.1